MNIGRQEPNFAFSSIGKNDLGVTFKALLLVKARAKNQH